MEKHMTKKIMPKNTSTKVNAIKIIESNREKSSATLLLPQEHKMLQNYNVILRIYVAFMIYSNFVVHRQRRHRYSRCHSRSSYRIHTQTQFFSCCFSVLSFMRLSHDDDDDDPDAYYTPYANVAYEKKKLFQARVR